ncbi:hypothetical protein HELRODRAFT_182016 [Helobdella robusta]|uniref:Innexin n=1 Tax=Helobdella robusta TaxID=6412 RepID=T1FHL5_HELRO|nr:hypothetical protein HELRODRAFT_182016 [Helobdella robusta]ESN91841.1 hypothetical protein HELRODRAFT_182016 [Helobdella robusta]
MDRLFKSVLSIRELKFHVDDDYIDRLSRQYTVVLMVLFAFLVSTKQFVGTPINCWCPAEFTSSHVDYTNAVCWVSNTYYVTIDSIVPAERLDMTTRDNQKISYYQWVPFILIIQGVLSFIPCQIWRFMNKRSGINLSTVMDAAHVSSEAAYLEIREKAVRYVVNQMDRYLMAQRDHRTGCCVRVKHFVAKLCCIIGGRLYGNYLISAYLFIKLLYIINAIGQLFLLDVLLVSDFHLYGVYILERLLRGQDWTWSNNFPRVTLCEFDMRLQSRILSYIVQCTLTINLFNEKIFFFVWFWYVFVAGVTLINFFQWLFKALYWPGQIQYVRKHIRAFDTTQQREHGVLSKFTECYLRRDGMFIIRLIGINMGEVAAGEVLCGLWNNYSPERRLMSEKPGRKQFSSSGSRPTGGVRRMEIV